MNVKVLGPGCKNCKALLDSTKQAVAELGIDADVEYITEMDRINQFVALTPGLVIDDKIIHQGKPLPRLAKIKKWLEAAKKA